MAEFVLQAVCESDGTWRAWLKDKPAVEAKGRSRVEAVQGVCERIVEIVSAA